MLNLSLMTDEEIIKNIAKAYEQHRLQLELSEDDICERGGVTKDAIHRFKNGKNINLKNFLAILRGVGKLNSLSTLFPETDRYSPIPKKNKPLKKRIHKKASDTTNGTDFVWGEDR